MSKKVIDVSQHNTINDFGKISKDVDAVIMRIGYRGYASAGTLKEDSKLKTFLSNCVKYKIPYGFYFFTQAKTEAEAKAEAQFCAKIIKGYKPTYPIYYDTEGSTAPNDTGRADKLSKAQRTNCCIAFCDEIKKLGYMPGIYASESWFSSNLNFEKIKKYSIWVAKYSKNKPKTSKYDAWQYTSKGKINGISGNCDVSYFYKDFNANKTITNKNTNTNSQKKDDSKKTTNTNNINSIKKIAANYKVGKTYVLQSDMKVRSGAGTKYSQKRRSELTHDGRENAKLGIYAILKKGTKITIQSIKIVNNSEIWVKFPSGYIAAYYNKKTYIK